MVRSNPKPKSQFTPATIVFLLFGFLILFIALALTLFIELSPDIWGSLGTELPGELYGWNFWIHLIGPLGIMLGLIFILLGYLASRR